MYFCVHIICINIFVVSFSLIFLLDYCNRLLSMQGIYAFIENGGQRCGTPGI